MHIGPKTTTLGREIIDLGGGDMKVATINIRSVKLHTPEPLHPATDVYGGNRAASSATTTIGDKTITDPVAVQVFGAPAPNPLNDEEFCDCTANGRNAWPSALSIDRGWRVGGGGRFIPCDGYIYCADSSTSSPSSITYTS